MEERRVGEDYMHSTTKEQRDGGLNLEFSPWTGSWLGGDEEKRT